MSSKAYITRAAMILIATLGVVKSLPADVETLFTTPQERQIINANRYKGDEVDKPPVIEPTETDFVAPIAQHETTIAFVISGITISGSGPHSVWINNQAYEDGERLEDNSRIKVITGENIRVRITTPDGKNYYGTSGEIVEVTYMASVEN